MSHWTLHLINARGQLDVRADTIRHAVSEVEARVAAVTAVPVLDITVSATRGQPEALFVSGHCYEPGVIGIGIDTGQAHSQAHLHAQLLKTLFHEVHHALRWDRPGYGDTLGEALVSEGLAQPPQTPSPRRKCCIPDGWVDRPSVVLGISWCQERLSC